MKNNQACEILKKLVELKLANSLSETHHAFPHLHIYMHTPLFPPSQ